MNKKTLKNLLKLSHVPRWVIVDIIKQQSVADHTFRVMAIAKYMEKKLELHIFNMLERIMLHDEEEALTGDIPSIHVNGNSFQVETVVDRTTDELFIMLADTIEAMIFLDRYVVRPARIRRYLESKVQTLQTELVKRGLASLTELIDEVLDIGRDYD